MCCCCILSVAVSCRSCGAICASGLQWPGVITVSVTVNAHNGNNPAETTEITTPAFQRYMYDAINEIFRHTTDVRIRVD